MTLSLVEFLLARITEDEAIIPAKINTENLQPWAAFANDEYDALLDFTRWAAECKAKRALVELHDEDREHNCPNSDGDSEHFGYLHGWAEGHEYPQRCPVLRLMASIYADHPDYDLAWQ